MTKNINGTKLGKLYNLGAFLSFLVFSFLAFTLFSPIVKSNAETIIKDYSVGAYTMSMTNTSEVDVIATANNNQQLYTAGNDVIFRNTCPKGAKIAISSKNGTNVLSDGKGNEILATAPGSELSDNSWGFSLDNGETWNSVPSTDINPLYIYDSNEAEPEDHIVQVLYGFKLSREIPDGTYTNDVMYTLTPDQDCFIYRINWESNGGTIPDGFPEYLNQDDLLDLSDLPRPTRDYYNFAGWRINGVTYTGDETDVDLNLNNDASITVETLWAPTTYPITYNLDGGSATNETSYNYESDAIALANPARRGYSFRGWSGTDLTGDTNKNVVIPEQSHGARSYTANWDTVPYSISYSLGGGTASNETTYNIESDTITLNNPTRTAYDFVGWSGTGLTGNNNKNVTIPAGSVGDLAFVANWTPTNYEISYSLGGGTASNETTYNIESDTITLNNPTRTAYDFVGWSGTGLTGNNNKNVTIASGSYGNRSYTANWTPTNYPISYTLNGGSASNNTSYNIETNSFTLNNPTRSYYDFVGWSGTGLSGTGNKTVTIAKGSTGARSYTANWTPTNYTITYNLNGGSASGNPTSYNIESNAFTLNNPTKSGVTFTGWSGTGLSGTGNKTVTIAKGSTGNRSYTANWAPTTTVWNYGYTGGTQSFTVPATGTYKLEVWGAQGGGAGSDDTTDARASGGLGGYSYGNATLTAGSTIYVVVGGAGTYGHQSNAASGIAGGYNGGGNGGGQTPAGSYKGGGSGGGATHIGKSNATLVNTASGNVYIVAGGGGGGYYHEWDSHNTGGSDGGPGNAGGGGSYGVGSSGGGGIQAAGGGGGWAGGRTGVQMTQSYGGTGYVGGVSGGVMQSGQRSGNGYARITWVGN